MAVLVWLGIGSSAYDAFAVEREWRASAVLGAGLGTGDDAEGDRELRWGPQAGAQLAYGIAEAFDLRVEALGAGYRQADGAAEIARFGAGALYKFDVTHWVPSLGVQGAYAVRLDRPASGVWLEPFLGVDYLFSRSWGFGLEYRFAVALAGGLEPPSHQVLLRFERRWGW